MSWARVRVGAAHFMSYFERASFPTWVIAAVAVLGLVYQWVDRRDERVRNAEAIHDLYMKTGPQKQFIDGNAVREIAVAGRCEYLRERAYLDPAVDCSMLTEAVLEKMSDIELNSSERKELRKRLDEALKDVPIDEGVVQEHLRFFERARLCAEDGSCDLNTARDLFERHIVIFLNSVCPYVERGRALRDLREETLALAKFVVEGSSKNEIWWTEDGGRESRFFCSYLRGIDDSSQQSVNSNLGVRRVRGRLEWP